MREFSHRHSIRLPGHDYASAGMYFVTMCTQGRERIFGDVVHGQVRLSDYGKIVAEEWQKTSVIRPNVTLDAWVVMPDHFHGIITIHRAIRDVGATRWVAHLGSIIGQFKMMTTKRIRKTGYEGRVWQRNYHERIIRNADQYQVVRQYIENNPARWAGERQA